MRPSLLSEEVEAETAWEQRRGMRWGKARGEGDQARGQPVLGVGGWVIEGSDVQLPTSNEGAVSS